MSDQPFDGNGMEIVTEVPALESMQRAEIDMQIATAKRYPRNIGAVKQAMMSFATLDQETAESCFYSLPRGGKNIKGPSVRLAEIALSCYQNMRAGSRIIQTVTTGDNPHVVIQAVAHDLEKNVAVTIEKRRRITKKKSKNTIDEDDINLAANAGSAVAFRDAVFKVIPGALIKPVYEQAQRVAIGDAKTLGDRRARAIEKFSKMGIATPRLLARLEKKSVEEIDLSDIETLIGLHNAIKDGSIGLDEAFPEEKGPLVETVATKARVSEDESAEAAVGLAPERPKADEDKPPINSAQDQLAAIVTGAGFNFEQWRDWAVSEGHLDKKHADLPAFDLVPDAVCTRLIRAKAGMLTQLAKKGVGV